MSEQVQIYSRSELTAEEKLAQTVSALRRLERWAQAYPVSVFPEPDMERVHQVLKDAGMGLDGVSAYVIRYVLSEVQDIVNGGLRGIDDDDD